MAGTRSRQFARFSADGARDLNYLVRFQQHLRQQDPPGNIKKPAQAEAAFLAWRERQTAKDK